MRRHVFVRPARKEEAGDFLNWSVANKDKNGFDPNAPLHSTSFVLAAYDKTGVLAYQPVQNPFFLEGIAVRPGLDKRQVAECLKEFTQFCVSQGHIKGVGEIYFLGTDEGTDALAENHVFEKLPYTVYRLKLKNTEQ